MRLLVAIALGLSYLCAQPCVPASIPSAGSVSGALDATSCLLSDTTAYNPYRLDLPTRGQIRIDLNPGQADLILILRDASGASIDSGIAIHRPIEAGSYTLLVDARVPGQTGAYTVQTAFSAEPGMLCDNFPSLGLSQSIGGTLGASGCVTPGNAPYEAYSLSTFGSGTVTVTATGANLPGLLFRDTGARVMASGIGTVSAAVSAGSQYQVVVLSAGGDGAFQLTTGFQPAPGEKCLPRKSLASSSTDANSITADSCWVTIDGSGDQAYYDYYNLVVSNSGLADLAVSSGDFNPSLVLLDGAGNSLVTDSDGDPYSTGTSHAEIRIELTPGTYAALVYSDVASGGNYNLSYSFTSGLPQPCPAASASAALTGTLSPASCRTVLGLSDLYSMALTSAGTLDITVSSADFVPALALRDAKDNLVVVDRDDAGLGVAHITADLPAGNYMILPAAVSGLGGYQMTTAFTPHDIPPCTYPFPLALNGTYYEHLGPSSCRGWNGQPLDLYSFTLPTDGVIASVVASSDIDGYLVLTDASGNLLRRDDNTYANNDPLIVQFLPAGTYHLAVRDAAASAGGPYALALYAALGPRPPFCSPRGSLPVGGSVTGNINSAGCQYGDNTLADIYRVDLLSDGVIDLRLNSSDFDAYLVLVDTLGDLVAQDDDSGGGTNSRINKKVPGGTYYVVAKPFSDYFSQGNYTLTLNSGTGYETPEFADR
jgi:hypothetical protein